MKYLTKDTTREEREKLIKDALAISLLDAGNPSPETMDLTQQYINGQIECDDIKKLVIDKYKNE